MTDALLPEIIAIGETMALVTPALAEPLERAVDFHLDAGGAESNVASHLAALRGRAAWAGRVGDDALGRRLVAQLASRGVDTRFVERDPDAPTGLYVKDPGNGVQYFRVGSAASRMSPAFAERLPLEGARVVHLSGITAALSSSCDAMLDAMIERVAATPALLSFDVNHRAALWRSAEAAAARLRALAAAADLAFVGLDEAARLWGTTTASDVRAFLPEPARLVVKDGDVGATEFARGVDGIDAVEHVAAHPVDVVEAVGAGDAFAAGYLAALLDDRDAAGRLRAGHDRAVLVLGETSDFPRDPRR
ncbi:sugar kinase [Agromyces sp. S2-1-8]|uniref:sugar kinase n=1 Tax=Agromyces sp. S2-1-8 TaxID=2897180 RepID=UPI001E532239|nr:sugar kinase [Agromyces sp. S2-1-8]MCD5347925.1 sugar kinase [Agromyces sp. S2-1-8]